MLLILLSLFIKSLSYSADIDPSEIIFVDDCVTYTIRREQIGAYPGKSCAHLKDGSVVSAGPDGLVSSTWKVSGNFKRISLGKNRIIALTDKELQIYSPEGKLLHKMPGEFSSAYEVPMNGNMILHGPAGVQIYSGDLSKLLFQMKTSKHIHDVQMNSRGMLLYFNASAGKTSVNPYSAVEEFDPRRKKVVWSFAADPKMTFYSPLGGGVQEIDEDVIFFHDHFDGRWFYSKKEKRILKSIPGKNGQPTIFGPTEKVTVMERTR